MACLGLIYVFCGTLEKLLFVLLNEYCDVCNKHYLFIGKVPLDIFFLIWLLLWKCPFQKLPSYGFLKWIEKKTVFTINCDIATLLFAYYVEFYVQIAETVCKNLSFFFNFQNIWVEILFLFLLNIKAQKEVVRMQLVAA